MTSEGKTHGRLKLGSSGLNQVLPNFTLQQAGGQLLSHFREFGASEKPDSAKSASYKGRRNIIWIYMILYGGFLKWGYPEIISFNRIFHDKPSILGYPHLWTPFKSTINRCHSELVSGRIYRRLQLRQQWPSIARASWKQIHLSYIIYLWNVNWI